MPDRLGGQSPARSRRDDPGVTGDVDDAIWIATQRTQAAQEAVAAELEAELMPPVPVVEEVARRAEDLDELAQQAMEQQTPPDD
jgi:hypothetical protein